MTNTRVAPASDDVAMTSSSVAVYSCEASVAMITASAMPRLAVLVRWDSHPARPNAGVSTSTHPASRRSEGVDRSTRLSRLPDGASGEVIRARASSHAISNSVSAPSSHNAAADLAGPQRTTVGTSVVRWTGVGQASAAISPFTSELLPFLNSPITNTLDGTTAALPAELRAGDELIVTRVTLVAG